MARWTVTTGTEGGCELAYDVMGVVEEEVRGRGWIASGGGGAVTFVVFLDL